MMYNSATNVILTLQINYEGSFRKYTLLLQIEQ